MDAVLRALATNEPRYRRDLAEFVAIPSVSTDPAHAADRRVPRQRRPFDGGGQHVGVQLPLRRRRRAEAVRDYLVSRHGIDPSRITVEGRDAREPVADNSTAEGRLRNRRVVIQLIMP